MTTLAPPPIPTASPPPPFASPAVSFLGRSLSEYEQFFALDVPALRGRDVLDVGAGASSFVAEACARRIDAVAIDPSYVSPVDSLAARMESDWANARPRLKPAGRSHPRRADAERRAAAERFLDDYGAHFLHGRYVGGALPRLPFFDGTFDLVLCADLLFTNAERFDFEWHLAACRELVRVTATEARIFSDSAEAKPYPGLARLRRELKGSGIASEVVSVEYEYGAGNSGMLVLRRSGA